MDELNLDLDNVEASAESKLKVKDRFAILTEKGLEAERKALEAEAKAKAESDRANTAEKRAEFLESFSEVSSKHPAAHEFKDQIFEKVQKGYDPEDAALSVLAKEGKLTNQTAPVQRQPQAEGGSAPTDLGDGGMKGAKEMTQAERAEALMQAEREGANLLKF